MWSMITQILLVLRMGKIVAYTVMIAKLKLKNNNYSRSVFDKSKWKKKSGKNETIVY